MFALLTAVLLSSPSFADEAQIPVPNEGPFVQCQVLANSVESYVIPVLVGPLPDAVTGEVSLGSYLNHDYTAKIGPNVWSLYITDAQGTLLYTDSSPAVKHFADLIDPDADARFQCSGL